MIWEDFTWVSRKAKQNCVITTLGKIKICLRKSSLLLDSAGNNNQKYKNEWRKIWNFHARKSERIGGERLRGLQIFVL
jgi:hypothetical protein